MRFETETSIISSYDMDDLFYLVPKRCLEREAFINTQLSPYGRMFKRQASMLIYVDSINYLYPLGLSS